VELPFWLAWAAENIPGGGSEVSYFENRSSYTDAIANWSLHETVETHFAHPVACGGFGQRFRWRRRHASAKRILRHLLKIKRFSGFPAGGRAAPGWHVPVSAGGIAVRRRKRMYGQWSGGKMREQGVTRWISGLRLRG
jgi:hypothetical protein